MIQEILKEKQKLINHRLAVLLKADRVEHETLYNAMNYSLLAGGKRIRPFLFSRYWIYSAWTAVFI